jgi:hypothetical protein
MTQDRPGARRIPTDPRRPRRPDLPIMSSMRRRLQRPAIRGTAGASRATSSVVRVIAPPGSPRLRSRGERGDADHGRTSRERCPGAAHNSPLLALNAAAPVDLTRRNAKPPSRSGDSPTSARKPNPLCRAAFGVFDSLRRYLAPLLPSLVFPGKGGMHTRVWGSTETEIGRSLRDRPWNRGRNTMQRTLVRIVLAAMLAASSLPAHVFAAEEPPSVPPRQTEGPDVRRATNPRHLACDAVRRACPIESRGVEGPATR